MTIDKATLKDLPTILSLFDAAQAWLVGKGLAEQWGTEPFSETQVERFTEWLERDVLYVLRDKVFIVGTLVINSEPPDYARSACEKYPRQALYLEAFAVHPNFRGRHFGRQLLEFAKSEARRRGVDWLRLDCWSGNEALKRYYVDAGYSRFAHCELGTWRGALFEKHIGSKALI